jgi:hypothetical protein
MPQSLTLPLVAGLAIIGAAAGVNLGRSAIAEINPAYFTDPDIQFHADLSPYRGPDWAQVQAAEYRQEAPPEGLGSGCIGCRGVPAVYLAEGPALAAGGGAWTAASALTEEAPAAVPPAPRDPDLDRVERYASYPLTAREAEQMAAERAPAEPSEAEDEILVELASTE